MNKYIPYLFGVLLLTAVVILFVTDNNQKKHQLNETITLRRQDKIPYGTYVANRNLKYLFPKATVYNNKYEPGYWDSLSVYESNQAFIAICKNFDPGEDEMKRLIRFVENGNDVFISARSLSYYAEKMIVGSEEDDNIRSFYRNNKGDMADTLTLSLLNPPYRNGYEEYKYPGKRYIGIFGKVNNSTTDIIGTDEEGAPYFIRLKAGKGNLFLHLAPLAFSNYFLLHKDNIGYYEKAMSVINADVTKILWDEYYLNKREDMFSDMDNEKKKGWLSVFMRYPGLKAALLTAIFSLLLYILLGMRRKQRYIPVITKPRNDSLDFVKTIGRLYYDKGDHKNLCRKMAAYFLEHVRNKYKLPTGNLDENFVNQLRFKSGGSEPEIRGIVSFIRYIDDAPAISNNDLTEFHKQLESFYQKT